MGHYAPSFGGQIHLVEAIADVAQLTVDNPKGVAWATQTTLSVDETAAIIKALQERYPQIEGPRKDDICYATQNRQDAVRELVENCEVVLVVGSKASSNSNRLRELAEQAGVPAYLIDTAEDIDPAWFGDCRRVGVTAGASAPEILVQQVIERLKLECDATLEEREPTVVENMIFPIPVALR